MQQDFLFELGTEELPAKMLPGLVNALAQGIQQGLAKAELSHDAIDSFATPRRIALLIKKLQTKQADRIAERKGPALSAAYDAQGQPTAALQGFARSCKTSIENLTKIDLPEGSWFVYRYEEAGKSIFELLPEIINKAMTALPIPKPMRWGDTTLEFIRPPHWCVLLYGSELIPATILNLPSQHFTYGHRFHHPEVLEIKSAADYEFILKEKGHVIANFQQRQQLIRQQAEALAASKNGSPIFTLDLLNEVTGLVEWPVALLGHFNPDFLKVPAEALIAAMEGHQKSFPLQDQKQQLLPYFITISNIESKDPQEVIRGNERVMRARLTDAKFFYETDCKRKLVDRLENLKTIIFQVKLGSLYEKSQRISQLTGIITEEKNLSPRAGLLCKADLATDMVIEFPELQGIMGSYYAEHDGETKEVSDAIREHYLPRFAGDELPKSPVSCAVAIADRLDTLIGIFGINQRPTGEKDPFGLRRAALAILRIIIERRMDLDLLQLLVSAKQLYQNLLANHEVVEQVKEFIIERLNAWYQDQNIAADTLAAVLAVQANKPLDIDQRVRAVQLFRSLPEAESLAAANKRVKNLLKQAEQLNVTNSIKAIDPKLFQSDIEQELYQAILNKQQQHAVNPSVNYSEILTSLASLRDPVDRFFDKVLVMDENEKLRNNRLALLASLRELFLAVADISLLHS